MAPTRGERYIDHTKEPMYMVGGNAKEELIKTWVMMVKRGWTLKKKKKKNELLDLSRSSRGCIQIAFYYTE